MPKVLGEVEASRIADLELVTRNEFKTLQSRYSRSYYVLSDNTSQSEGTIVSTTGVPPIYSFIGGAWCVKQSLKELATIGRHPSNGNRCILYEVKCDFDSEADVQEADQPPEARTPKVSWHGEYEEHVVEKDAITGEPIQTVPGDPIDVTAPYPIPILEIRRFELPPFNPLLQLEYACHTNSQPFYGAPEGCALMSGIQAGEEEVVNNRRVIPVTYMIKFKFTKDKDGALEKDGWAFRPVHRGPSYLPAVGKPPQQALDGHGYPRMVNLKADGTQLPFDSPPEDIVYLKFNINPKANFNLLNLGPF